MTGFDKVMNRKTSEKADLKEAGLKEAVLAQPEHPQPSAKPQYGITALFWVTFLVGVGIAYLQRLNSEEILIGAAIGIGLAVLIGGLVGLITKNVSDSFFWATLVAAFAYISVATDPNYDQVHRIVWAIVGAFTAAIAATVFTKRPFLSASIGAVVAFGCLGIYWLVTRNQSIDLKVDLIAAPIIAFAVAGFVRLLMWLESKKKMPRYLTASWLLAIVIIANYFSR